LETDYAVTIGDPIMLIPMKLLKTTKYFTTCIPEQGVRQADWAKLHMFVSVSICVHSLWFGRDFR
jgi:hypothetical protein